MEKDRSYIMRTVFYGTSSDIKFAECGCVGCVINVVFARVCLGDATLYGVFVIRRNECRRDEGVMEREKWPIV